MRCAVNTKLKKIKWDPVLLERASETEAERQRAEKDREMRNSAMLKAINITKIPCNRRKHEGTQYEHSNAQAIVISMLMGQQ